MVYRNIEIGHGLEAVVFLVGKTPNDTTALALA
jgi:hypothetical protein